MQVRSICVHVCISAAINRRYRKEEFAKQKNELLAGFEDFSRAMRLSVAYAANVGGTATITGSPTNLVAKEMLDQYVSVSIVVCNEHLDIIFCKTIFTFN